MPVAGKISDIIQKRVESVKPLYQVVEMCDSALRMLDILDNSMSKFVKDRDPSEKGVLPCNDCLIQFPNIKKQISELQSEAKNR